MKKEWLLTFACGLATLGTALLLIRWLAPGLLGVPTDLQLVRVDKKIPPFYDNVFRLDELHGNRTTLQDPLTKTRRLPLMPAEGSRGPHDILGFRNRSVPNVSDVVVIGDSQSYGFNVPLEFNWPSTLAERLKDKRTSVFNMAVGGWGAVQYGYISRFAHLFLPRVVIVAFYTGNDPLESFSMAYGSELWQDQRPDPNLSAADAPQVRFPTPPEEEWEVTFADGVKTIFTPELRLAANLDNPAVRAGYEIMARTAELIAAEAARSHFQVFFTIIPTKELVYAEKIRREDITPPVKYVQLISNETGNINNLVRRINALKGSRYINLVSPMQRQALLPAQLYPDTANGHPVYDGYALIGRVIADRIAASLPDPPAGFFRASLFKTGKSLLYYAEDGYYWVVPQRKQISGSGRPNDSAIPFLPPRDLANLEFKGILP